MANAPVVALLLLLAVLGVAAVAPRRVAVAASLAAAFVVNFFFIPPFGTLHIASVDDFLVWIVFLAVSLIGVQLASTARQRTAEALSQRDELARLLSEREAGEAAKRRAELASALLKSMGHDLRTPLTAIEIAAVNLQEPAASDDLRREQAAIITEQVGRLTRVFDRIVAMARIDAGVLQPEPEWAYGGDIIEAAIQEVGDALASYQVRPVFNEAPAFIDPRLTATALARVVENAARHAPRGSTIVVNATTHNGLLEIVVDDEGPGIATEDLPHLFEPFFTTATDGRRGLGMGLAIARGLMLAQRGSITAENRVGGGARFRMSVGRPGLAAFSS